MTGAVTAWIDAVTARVEERVFGMEEAARAIAMARLARGHVLLESVPGLGKTMLARTLGGAFGGRFNRVQCTSDLMPADVIGTTVYETERGSFAFRPGPVFADLLLVDEINRTGPRTQSALLEAMQERAVTVDGQRHPLPEEFTVVATQNPVEFEGTYPLPESQIDRFLVRLVIDHPQAEVERRVLATYADTRGDLYTAPGEALPTDLVDAARAEADATTVSDALLDYVVELAAATRRHPAVALGLSTRGARALLLMARIAACAEGADFVRPDDVKRVAPWVVGHRLVLAPEAQLEGLRDVDLLQQILDDVAVPR